MATIPGVSDGELIRTTWGDAVADELNGNVVKKTTDQVMAGGLTAANLSTAAGGSIAGSYIGAGVYCHAPAFFHDSAQVTDANATTRKDYVDSTTVSVTGDTMTGNLTVGVDPFSEQPGSQVGTGILASLIAAAGTSNVYLFKKSPNFGVGSDYIGFYGQNGATGLGSISIASGSSVAYNTTSDPRLKTPPTQARMIDDAVDRARQLGNLAWQGQRLDINTGEPDDTGVTWDFLSSHDVEDVAPYAVQGERDAVDGDGNPIYQQVDYSSLVPLLFSALSQALERIEVLEAAAT